MAMNLALALPMLYMGRKQLCNLGFNDAKTMLSQCSVILVSLE